MKKILIVLSLVGVTFVGITFFYNKDTSKNETNDIVEGLEEYDIDNYTISMNYNEDDYNYEFTLNVYHSEDLSSLHFSEKENDNIYDLKINEESMLFINDEEKEVVDSDYFKSKHFDITYDYFLENLPFFKIYDEELYDSLKDGDGVRYLYSKELNYKDEDIIKGFIEKYNNQIDLEKLSVSDIYYYLSDTKDVLTFNIIGNNSDKDVEFNFTLYSSSLSLMNGR